MERVLREPESSQDTGPLTTPRCAAAQHCPTKSFLCPQNANAGITPGDTHNAEGGSAAAHAPDVGTTREWPRRARGPPARPTPEDQATLDSFRELPYF